MDKASFFKYFRNTSWLVLARVGSLLIKFLVSISVANYLGATLNGKLAFPIAFCTIFIAAAALGLDAYTTRELLRHPQKKYQLIGSGVLLRILSGLLFIPLIWLAYQFWKIYQSAPVPDHYILIYSTVGIWQAVFLIDSWFQANVQGKRIAIVQISANLLSALIKLSLIASGAELIWFVIALAGDSLLLAALYLFLYRRSGEKPLNWQAEKPLAKELIKNSWPLAFSAILVSLYMKVDQVMIEAMLGSTELGIYSTVVSLSESWYFLPVAIAGSVFPAIMNARRDDPQRFQQRIRELYQLMVLLSLALALVVSFSSDFIYALLYRPQFASGAPVLSVHIWAAVFVFLGTASSQYLVAEGFTRYSMYRTAAGALTNVLLNLFLIPKYGILGAAWATLIAYGVATFSIVFWRPVRLQAWHMLKALFLVYLIKKIRNT